jgi:hypothetical protein
LRWNPFNIRIIAMSIILTFASCAGPERDTQMIEIIDPHRPTSRQEIDSFEQRMSIKLPLEYRNWLLKYNGGSPRPRVFRAGSGPEQWTSCVAWFYAIYEGRLSNLEREITTFKIKETRIPKDLIPIADDPGGNQICLGYEGPNLGKVFFWDHERECDGSYDNCYLIANSFNEFIASLKDD